MIHVTDQDSTDLDKCLDFLQTCQSDKIQYVRAAALSFYMTL